MGRAVRLTMVVCLALVFASCGVSPSGDVIGKWKVADGSGTVEFTRAGMLNLTQGKISSNFYYRFTSPTHLNIDLGPFGKMGWDVKLDKDVMTLTGPEGKTLQLKKVQDQARKQGVAKKEQAQPKQQGQVQQAQPQHQKAQPQQAAPQQAPQHQPKEHQKPQQHGQQLHKS